MVKRLTRDMLAIVHEHAVQVYPSTGDKIREKSANVSTSYYNRQCGETCGGRQNGLDDF